MSFEGQFEAKVESSSGVVLRCHVAKPPVVVNPVGQDQGRKPPTKDEVLQHGVHKTGIPVKYLPTRLLK